MLGCLEDANLFHKDIHTLAVDYSCAYNSVSHDRMFKILEWLGIPQDIITAIKGLYDTSTTEIVGSNWSTGPIPVTKGVLQGDGLSPLLFILSITPLLRWLELGEHGYACTNENPPKPHHNTVSPQDGPIPAPLPNPLPPAKHTRIACAAYADDILLLTRTARGMQIQAHKIALYSQWMGMVCNLKKCAASALCFQPNKDQPVAINDNRTGVGPKTELSRIQLWGKQGDGTVGWGPPDIIEPTTSYRYLGIELDLTLRFRAERAYVADKLNNKKNKIKQSVLYGELGRNSIECVLNGILRYHSAAMIGTPNELDAIERHIRAGLRSVLGLPPGTATAHLRRPDEYMGEGLTSVQQITRENAKKQVLATLREPNRAGPLARALTNTYALRFGTGAHAPFGPNGGAIIPHRTLAQYTWARRLLELSQEECAILDTSAPTLDTTITLFQLLVQIRGHVVQPIQYPKHPLPESQHAAHYHNIHAKNIQIIARNLQPLWELGLTHVHQLWRNNKALAPDDVQIERHNQDDPTEYTARDVLTFCERRRKAWQYATTAITEYKELLPAGQPVPATGVNTTDSSSLITYAPKRALPVRHADDTTTPHETQGETIRGQIAQRRSWNDHPSLKCSPDRWRDFTNHPHRLNTETAGRVSYPQLQSAIRIWAHIEKHAIIHTRTSLLQWCTHTYPISLGTHFRAAVYHTLEANHTMMRSRLQMLAAVLLTEDRRDMDWSTLAAHLAKHSHILLSPNGSAPPRRPGLTSLPTTATWLTHTAQLTNAYKTLSKPLKLMEQAQEDDKEAHTEYTQKLTTFHTQNTPSILLQPNETPHDGLIRTLNKLPPGHKWVSKPNLFLFELPPEYFQDAPTTFITRAHCLHLTCTRIPTGTEANAWEEQCVAYAAASTPQKPKPLILAAGTRLFVAGELTDVNGTKVPWGTNLTIRTHTTTPTPGARQATTHTASTAHQDTYELLLNQPTLNHLHILTQHTLRTPHETFQISHRVPAANETTIEWLEHATGTTTQVTHSGRPITELHQPYPGLKPVPGWHDNAGTYSAIAVTTTFYSAEEYIVTDINHEQSVYDPLSGGLSPWPSHAQTPDAWQHRAPLVRATSAHTARHKYEPQQPTRRFSPPTRNEVPHTQSPTAPPDNPPHPPDTEEPTPPPAAVRGNTQPPPTAADRAQAAELSPAAKRPRLRPNQARHDQESAAREFKFSHVSGSRTSRSHGTEWLVHWHPTEETTTTLPTLLMAARNKRFAEHTTVLNPITGRYIKRSKRTWKELRSHDFTNDDSRDHEFIQATHKHPTKEETTMVEWMPAWLTEKETLAIGGLDITPEGLRAHQIKYAPRPELCEKPATQNPPNTWNEYYPTIASKITVTDVHRPQNPDHDIDPAKLDPAEPQLSAREVHILRESHFPSTKRKIYTADGRYITHITTHRLNTLWSSYLQQRMRDIPHHEDHIRKILTRLEHYERVQPGTDCYSYPLHGYNRVTTPPEDIYEYQIKQKQWREEIVRLQEILHTLTTDTTHDIRLKFTGHIKHLVNDTGAPPANTGGPTPTAAKNAWTLPDALLQHLTEAFIIKHEVFSSPLNWSPHIPNHYTLDHRDAPLGAITNAYSRQWLGSNYGNPEYSPYTELSKAIRWAAKSAHHTTASSSTILILPEFREKNCNKLLDDLKDYCEILFRIPEGNFHFQHANAWDGQTRSSTGVAPFATLIVRISNAQGRREHFSQPAYDKLRELLTGTQTNTDRASRTTANAPRRPTWTPAEPPPTIRIKDFPQKAQPMPRTPPQPNAQAHIYEPTTTAHDTLLRYYHEHTAFSDGSQLQNAHPDAEPSRASAGFTTSRMDDAADPTDNRQQERFHSFVWSGVQDVNRGEHIAILEGLRHLPRLGPDGVWHIFSDSLVTLTNIKKGVHRMHAMYDSMYINTIRDIIRYCNSRQESFQFHKVRAHTEISGNEMADLTAKLGNGIIAKDSKSGIPVEQNHVGGIEHVPQGVTLQSPWPNITGRTSPLDEFFLPRTTCEPTPTVIPQPDEPEWAHELAAMNYTWNLHTTGDAMNPATSPYIYYNPKADIARISRKLHMEWTMAERRKDKYAPLLSTDAQLRPYAINPTLTPSLRTTTNSKQCRYVRLARYNVFAGNHTVYFRAKLEARGLSALCPLCQTATDSHLHRRSRCQHPKMAAANTQAHDMGNAIVAERTINGEQGGFVTFADLKGLRVSDKPERAGYQFDFDNMFTKKTVVDTYGTTEPEDPFIGEPSEDPDFDEIDPLQPDPDEPTAPEPTTNAAGPSRPATHPPPNLTSAGHTRPTAYNQSPASKRPRHNVSQQIVSNTPDTRGKRTTDAPTAPDTTAQATTTVTNDMHTALDACMQASRLARAHAHKATPPQGTPDSTALGTGDHTHNPPTNRLTRAQKGKHAMSERDNMESPAQKRHQAEDQAAMTESMHHSPQTNADRSTTESEETGPDHPAHAHHTEKQGPGPTTVAVQPVETGLTPSQTQTAESPLRAHQAGNHEQPRHNGPPEVLDAYQNEMDQRTRSRRNNERTPSPDRPAAPLISHINAHGHVQWSSSLPPNPDPVPTATTTHHSAAEPATAHPHPTVFRLAAQNKYDAKIARRCAGDWPPIEQQSESDSDEDYVADAPPETKPRIGTQVHMRTDEHVPGLAGGHFTILSFHTQPGKAGAAVLLERTGLPPDDAPDDSPQLLPWALFNKHKSRTIPSLIDPDTSQCPDMVRLLGLKRGEPIPPTPTKDIRIQIIEIAFAREGHIEEAARRKINKYKHLLVKYARWGWGVDPLVRVIIIGHRGGIPNITLTTLQALGDTDPKRTCWKLSAHADIRMAHSLRLSRIIESTDPEIKQRSAIGLRIWNDKGHDNNAPT